MSVRRSFSHDSWSAFWGRDASSNLRHHRGHPDRLGIDRVCRAGLRAARLVVGQTGIEPFARSTGNGSSVASAPSTIRPPQDRRDHRALCEFRNLLVRRLRVLAHRAVAASGEGIKRPCRTHHLLPTQRGRATAEAKPQR